MIARIGHRFATLVRGTAIYRWFADTPFLSLACCALSAGVLAAVSAPFALMQVYPEASWDQDLRDLADRLWDPIWYGYRACFGICLAALVISRVRREPIGRWTLCLAAVIIVWAAREMADPLMPAPAP